MLRPYCNVYIKPLLLCYKNEAKLLKICNKHITESYLLLGQHLR